MNIYSFPTFNLTKVLLTAEELAMDYRLHLLDMSKGEHKSPEHMQRHPLGKVPAVEIDGQYFFESNSICRLLSELNGNRLYGNTPQERAVVNEWVDLLTQHIGRWLTVYFFEEIVKPGILKGRASPVALEEAAGFLMQQLPALDKVLSESTYIARNDISIADTIGFSLFSTHEVTTVDLSAYSNIVRWYQNLAARPTYKRALSHLPGASMFAAFGK